MMAQWENECISLSVLSIARVQFPAMAEYFKGSFSLADHTLVQAESLLMMHPGKPRVKDSVGQFLHHS